MEKPYEDVIFHVFLTSFCFFKTIQLSDLWHLVYQTFQETVFVLLSLPEWRGVEGLALLPHCTKILGLTATKANSSVEPSAITLCQSLS